MRRSSRPRTLSPNRYGSLEVVALGEIGAVVLLIALLLTLLAGIGLVDARSLVQDDSESAGTASQSASELPIYQMSVAHTADTVALCRFGSVVELRDLRTGEALDRSSLPRLDSRAKAVAISADGGRIAIGCADGSIVFRIEEASGVRDLVVTGHDQPISSLSFAADGSLAVSASADGAVRIWDAAAGKLLRVLQLKFPLWNSRTWLMVSRDGKLVLLGGQTGHVACWRTEDHQPLESFSVAPGVGGIALSPDGQALVIASLHQQDLRSIDLRSGREFWRHVHPEPGSRYTSLAVSPDGELVVAGDSFGWIHSLDAATGRLLTSFKAHDGGVSCLQYEGEVLYSGSHDGRVSIWQAGELAGEAVSGRTRPAAD